MLTRDALIACLPPQAYDRSAPGVQAEAAVAGAVLDDAIISADVILSEQQSSNAALALPDWERNHGLPDACIGGAGASAAQRLAYFLERISARGNLSLSYFTDLAASLGYPGCTITEFGPMTCADACDSYVNGPEFIGVWRLNVATPTAVIVMTCESACDASLAIGGNTQLECLINRRKPAHTKAVFSYAP